jgi:DNA-binding transcriptional LysR family regulator
MASLKSNTPNSRSRTSAIDLKQLQFAVAADDCGSLRHAAETLGVRHSVLSRSIVQLEHLIGSKLFDRSSGGVKPTSTGRRALRMARLMLEQAEALVETGRSEGRGDAGGLAIGFFTSISTGNLRAALLEYRRRFPKIELATTERSSTCLLNALRSGTLDVIIAAGQVPAMDNKVLPLWSERILISLPQGHPLATRDVVYWTDLRNETLLLSQHDQARELEDLLMSKLVSSQGRPKIERHDVSRGIIKSLTSMGLGISLVMESDMGASFAGLVYRELQDGMGSSHIDFSAHWRADNNNPTLQCFLELFAERYSSSACRE